MSERHCLGCGEPIDRFRRSDAKFCPGSKCRMRYQRGGGSQSAARSRQRPIWSRAAIQLFERLEEERQCLLSLLEADETCIKGTSGGVGTPMGGPGGLTAWGVYLKARQGK